MLNTEHQNLVGVRIGFRFGLGSIIDYPGKSPDKDRSTRMCVCETVMER